MADDAVSILRQSTCSVVPKESWRSRYLSKSRCLLQPQQLIGCWVVVWAVRWYNSIELDGGTLRIAIIFFGGVVVCLSAWPGRRDPFKSIEPYAELAERERSSRFQYLQRTPLDYNDSNNALHGCLRYDESLCERAKRS